MTPTPPPPPPGEPVLLEPCFDDTDWVLTRTVCLPPRPSSVNHDPELTAGSGSLLNGTFENPYESEIERALVGIETPSGWQSQLVSDATFDAVGQGYLPIGRLGPEESRNVSWLVTPPESADGGQYNVTVVSEWAVPGYEVPDGPDNDTTDGSYFRVRKNYTYRVRPIECRGVDPCSLLANDTAGSQPFGDRTLLGNTTNTMAGYLYNPHDRTITNGTVTLDPPDTDWNVSPVNGTTFGALGPGESRPIEWDIRVPETTGCGGDYTLEGTARYDLEGGDRIAVPFSLTVRVFSTEPCAL